VCLLLYSIFTHHNSKTPALFLLGYQLMLTWVMRHAYIAKLIVIHNMSYVCNDTHASFLEILLTSAIYNHIHTHCHDTMPKYTYTCCCIDAQLSHAFYIRHILSKIPDRDQSVSRASGKSQEYINVLRLSGYQVAAAICHGKPCTYVLCQNKRSLQDCSNSGISILCNQSHDVGM